MTKEKVNNNENYDALLESAKHEAEDHLTQLVLNNWCHTKPNSTNAVSYIKGNLRYLCLTAETQFGDICLKATQPIKGRHDEYFKVYSIIAHLGGGEKKSELTYEEESIDDSKIASRTMRACGNNFCYILELSLETLAILRVICNYPYETLCN